MGSDRVQVGNKSSSTLTPGFKPEQSIFLQRRYQDRVEAETDSFTEDKQQNFSDQGNSRPPLLTHSFGRMSVLPIQTKLTIGQPNDKYEQEADRFAAQVVQQINSPQTQQSGGIQRDAVHPEDDKSLQTKPVISTLQRETMPEKEKEELQAKPIADRIQRQEMPEEEGEEELQVKPVTERIQRQEMPEEEEEELQRKSSGQQGVDGGGVASAGLETSIQGARGQGQPLGDEVRGPMERAFGTDFSGVRVHSNAQSDQLNKSIQARAFTTGQDIFFRQGEYVPGSLQGKRLLAHELTHVVQQQANKAPRAVYRDSCSSALNLLGDTIISRLGGGSIVQRKCDEAKATRWYTRSRSGKKIRWTVGLVEEMYKVVGPGHKSLYDKALAEKAIGPHFIRLACKAQEVLGFSGKDVDGKIGSKTISAWKKWKTGGARGIDYGRLFKDKKLEIGIAIGEPFHSSEFVNIVKFLKGRKFKLTHDSVGKKSFIKKKRFSVQGDKTAPPVEIEIIVDVISEKAVSPKKTFGKFLSEKEITIYSGHARSGTGPDFDPKASPAENFVIGVNSALHKAGRLKKSKSSKMKKILKNRKNDIEAMSKVGKFDVKKYQVWFFNACTTMAYLDEIRGGLVTSKKGKKKSRADLRFFGTKKGISLTTEAIPILEGVLDMQTMEEIIAAMHKAETGKEPSKGKSDIFFAD